MVSSSVENASLDEKAVARFAVGWKRNESQKVSLPTGRSVAYNLSTSMSSDEPRSACEFDSGELILSIDMAVPADVREIAPVVQGIMKQVKRMGCVPGKEDEVRLAISEALANAIVHGCKKDPSKQVEFWVGCDQSRGILIVVRDPGEGFDPSTIPSPVVGQNIFSSGGRGIYLINQLMDEVRFEKGGTEIRMLKK